jgi:uncharacterized protein (TIGR03437 family)
MKIGSLALKLCLCLVAAVSAAAAATPAVLSASPSAVDFAYSPGEPTPADVFVTVTASDGSSPVLSVTVNPAAGMAATLFPQPPIENGNIIDVGFNGNTLTSLLPFPGVYIASLTVTAAGFNNLTIPLTFVVGGNVSIIPSSASLSFNVPSGSAVQTQTIEILGNGGAAVSFTAASVGTSWLSVTANATYTPATLTVTINPLNLAGGTYTGSITVTPTSGAALVIPVTLQVGANTLSAAPASLAFAYTLGGTMPPPQVLQLSSSVPNDTYTAQAASSGNWLLANGVTTQISGPLPASLNVTVNTAGLAAGTYTGNITATDTVGGTQNVAVTLVVSGISDVANPASLVFVAQAGEAAPPAPQIVEVAFAPNATYTATVNGAWLAISSAGGSVPAQLTVSVNPAGLAAGTYTGSVAIDLDTHIQDIAVTLIVSANPVLTTNPGMLIFNYFGGSLPPSVAALDVNVSSGSSQTFTIAPGVPAWLQISSGGAGLVTQASLAVGVTPQTLPSGTYLADIILTPAVTGSPTVVVPVLLLISDATAVVPNLTSLTFSATAGGAPQSQTVEVTATPTTSFTTGASTVSGGSWLSVSPASATANGGYTPLTVTASAGNLAAGTYQGNVTLTTTGGVVTTIPVTITVAGGSGPVGISPSTLAFTFIQNGALPAAQSLQITGSQSFTASAATAAGGTWLAVTPESGTGNVSLSVSVNPAGLAPGNYNGSITVTPAGGVAQTVAVTLTVSAPVSLAATPNPLAFAYTAGNPAPAAQTVAITSTGQAVTFTATASSSGWLSVTQSGASTPATLSVAVNPADLGAGSYNGSIALSGDSGALQLNIAVTLTVMAPLPVIGSVTNAASYLAGGISPGEIVTIFGTSLGPTTGVSSAINKGFIPTTFANVTVTFNGYPGPILYAGAGQINAIVPYELFGASNASVEVVFGSARSNSVTLAVVSAAPGIFSANASGQGPGAILDVNYQLVSASNPVSVGATIQVFATGQGQTSPGGVDGLIEPLSLPLPVPLLNVGATIGGLPANIQYVGAAPGLVAGALQVNIVVPAGVASGPAPLFISFGGMYNSQTGITVAIQ